MGLSAESGKGMGGNRYFLCFPASCMCVCCSGCCPSLFALFSAVLQPPLPRHPFSHLQMAIGNSPSRSDARVSVLAVLALGAVATLIAFVSPNWLASDTRLYGAEFLKLGLWETCFRSFRGIDDTDFRKYFAGCRWIFREEYQSIRSFLMPGQ